MPYRLRISETQHPISLEFTCTLGYVEYLRDQLEGLQQPITPCLVFKIRSFRTLGNRLGAYLSGVPYDRISIGDFGSRPDSVPSTSSRFGVENTSVGLILEVDRDQLIELHQLYQSICPEETPPYSWTTIIPKGVVQPFNRQTSVLNRRLRDAIFERVQGVIKCPHCDERHTRGELEKEIKTRPGLSSLQANDDLNPSWIIITVRCPIENTEIEIDSTN